MTHPFVKSSRPRVSHLEIEARKKMPTPVDAMAIIWQRASGSFACTLHKQPVKGQQVGPRPYGSEERRRLLVAKGRRIGWEKPRLPLYASENKQLWRVTRTPPRREAILEF